MSTIAKGGITLVTVNDAYTVSLTASSYIIKADFDGSNPQLDHAKSTITIQRGSSNVPFRITSLSKSSINIIASYTDQVATEATFVLSGIGASELDGWVDLTIITEDGCDYQTTIRITYSVVRESTMLDWIQAWESNKTTIGATSIITPKLFVGKKITGSYDSLAEVPGLTGVYIGPSKNDSCGLYGYKDSIEIFHLDETGGKIGGWDLSQDGLYSSNGKLRILSDGSIRAVNDEFDTIWEVCSDGSASFALGNVKFYANGDAEFKGKITSSEGKIASWTITDSLLHCVPMALSAIGKYIALANISSYPLLADGSWNGNHFNWVQQYGGATLYYTSSTDFGLKVYQTTNKKVFAAGSNNLIAGWSFDENALWIGTKNNNPSQYTANGSLTIGSEGLRGNTWYIDSDGTASFVKGLVTFGDTSGTIVGWNLTSNKIATNYIALSSASGYSGLYMTPSADGNFVDKGVDAMGNFIEQYGGIYITVNSDNAYLGAYNSTGSRLFKIQSSGTNYIAGWCFNDTSLWTGSSPVASGFTEANNISIGPDGLRGYKWRFENDGSGAIAGGSISWTTDGVVTFTNQVVLNWDNIGGEIGDKLTYIDAHGVYTGTISADNITAGTITTASMICEGKWALYTDGSGYLAANNIHWDIDGNATFEGEIQATSGKIGNWSIVDGIITANSNNNSVSLNADDLSIVVQASAINNSYVMNPAFGAKLSMDAVSGMVQAQAISAPSYTTAISYISANGVFSNIAGINGMPTSSGYTHRAAVVGLGYANVSKSDWQMDANETIVAGVYGRAINSGTAPAYGGFFYNLFASGLVLGRKCITKDSGTVYLEDTNTLILGYSSSNSTVYLPSNPKEGQTLLFRQWQSGSLTIRPYPDQLMYDSSIGIDYINCAEGEMVIAVFTIGYKGADVIEAWLVYRLKFTIWEDNTAT